MASIETVERLSKRYSMSPDQFIKYGSSLALKEKKRSLQIEKREILARSNSGNIQELEEKIRNDNISEHPAWEDLIELKNIDDEIRAIESDLKTLQATRVDSC